MLIAFVNFILMGSITDMCYLFIFLILNNKVAMTALAPRKDRSDHT